MALELSEAEYVRVGVYPLLRVKVGGKVATIEPAAHPALFDAGLVPLGEGFGLPDVEFQADDGPATTLEGYSDDRRLFLLYARFSRACGDGTFRPGPAPIPRADEV